MSDAGFAARAGALESFLAMDVLERALELEAAGAKVLHLELGEPDAPPPAAAVEACRAALAAGETHYTDSRGLRELREAIAADKARRTGVPVDPDRVLVTSGTSPAMLLVFGLLVAPGDEVILASPHYACYPNFVRFCGGTPVLVRCEPGDGWRVHVERVRAARTARSRAVVVASPANPTGAVQSRETLAALAELGLPLVSDEIYDGLVYGDANPAPSNGYGDANPAASHGYGGADAPSAGFVQGHAPSALETGAGDVYVLDGFSKRYAMTGFRLGYVIAPAAAARPLQVMQQNLFISASEFVQRAGLAALAHGEPTVRTMRERYGRQRRLLLDGLARIGLRVDAPPAGAFYVLADARHVDPDSRRLAARLLEEAHVALTPGVDFGPYAEGFLRFSYAVSEATLEEALARLGAALG